MGRNRNGFSTSNSVKVFNNLFKINEVNVKRSILLLTFLFATVLSAQTAQPAAQFKVGYVDSEVILAQFPEAIKAKSDLEGLVAQWRKEADSLTADLQKLYADYQKQSGTMKADEQQKAQKNIVEKEQRLQQYRDQKFSQPNGEYFTKQDQLMAPVKKKIFQAIEDVAKEEGMQYVLDKAGEVIVLYADAQYDVTFKVLDRLKRGK